MEECVDGSISCFETTNNLLDFSVIEAHWSSGPKTNLSDSVLWGRAWLVATGDCEECWRIYCDCGAGVGARRGEKKRFAYVGGASTLR